MHVLFIPVSSLHHSLSKSFISPFHPVALVPCSSVWPHVAEGVRLLSVSDKRSLKMAAETLGPELVAQSAANAGKAAIILDLLR